MADNTLLNEVKSFINFTWDDPLKESRLVSFIESSKQYLEEVAGQTIDFSTDHLAHDLLLNRVLYMDSQALDDFMKNYTGLIDELKIKYYPYVDENSR